MKVEREVGQIHTTVNGHEVVLFSKLVAQMEVGIWNGTEDTDKDYICSTEHQIPELGCNQKNTSGKEAFKISLRYKLLECLFGFFSF